MEPLAGSGRRPPPPRPPAPPATGDGEPSRPHKFVSRAVVHNSAVVGLFLGLVAIVLTLANAGLGTVVQYVYGG